MPHEEPINNPQPTDASDPPEPAGDDVTVLQQQVASLTDELTAARSTIDALERRQKISLLFQTALHWRVRWQATAPLPWRGLNHL